MAWAVLSGSPGVGFGGITEIRIRIGTGVGGGPGGVQGVTGQVKKSNMPQPVAVIIAIRPERHTGFIRDNGFSQALMALFQEWTIWNWL